MEISKDQWLEWRDNGVTKAVKSEISNLLDLGVEYLLSGEVVGDVGKTGIVIGKLQAYRDFLNISYEDIGK